MLIIWGMKLLTCKLTCQQVPTPAPDTLISEFKDEVCRVTGIAAPLQKLLVKVNNISFSSFVTYQYDSLYACVPHIFIHVNTHMCLNVIYTYLNIFICIRIYTHAYNLTYQHANTQTRQLNMFKCIISCVHTYVDRYLSAMHTRFWSYKKHTHVPSENANHTWVNFCMNAHAHINVRGSSNVTSRKCG